MDDILAKLAKEPNSTRPVKLPAIKSPTATQASILDALRSVKTILDAREGVSGSILDKSLTLRDLLDAGALQLTVGGKSYGSAGPGGSIQFPGLDGDQRPWLEVPPPATALTVAGTFKQVFLRWELPVYRNHSYVEVWRATSNSLGDAVLIGVATSNMYIDATGAAGVTYWYWVRAVGYTKTGDPITGPFNAVSGVSGGPQVISGADVSDLVIEAENLAEGAVDLSSNKVVADGKFGALAVGWTITQYLVAKNGVMENLVVDDAQIGAVSAMKLTAGDGTIGGTLKSENYSPGGAGWVLKKDGTFEAGGGTFRGDIAAQSGYLKGAVYGGSYGNSYAWPGGSGIGYYLGAGGLLLGNPSTGKYFQITDAGEVFAPGFKIQNGNAIFTGIISGATGIFSGALQAATGSFAGSLQGASGTFGTITAGILYSSNYMSYVNLNATGSSTFLSVNGGSARITADGDAFFTKSLASGTYGGGNQLAKYVQDTVGGGDSGPGTYHYDYSPVTVYIDTGLNTPYSAFSSRTFTVRIAPTGTGYVTPGKPQNAWIGDFAVDASVVVFTPYFGNPVTAPQNPYGGGNSRIYIKAQISLENRQGAYTSIIAPPFSWTLDTVG